MLLNQDEFDQGVLELIASDTELLDLSINDLAIALGGNLSSVDESYIHKIKYGNLFDCFCRKVRNQRTFRYYKQFQGLDLPVDSFVRILKLHLDRGFSFLSKAKLCTNSIKLFCLCYVDVVFDLHYGILKQVSSFTLHDCVYLYKFFLKLDTTLVSYKIKHVYVRDEIYDLILHTLWFALKDAWWLYLKPKFIRPLFPFISHMRVENCYDVSVKDLNHVLHNIHFVTLISQDISFQSETATLVDNSSKIDRKEFFEPVDKLGTFKEHFNYENISESDLEIKYMKNVDGLESIKQEEYNGTTELEYNLTLDIPKEMDNNILTNYDLNGFMESGSQICDYPIQEDSYTEPNWSQVVYVALVGCTYIVMFESYLNAFINSLKTSMSLSNYVEFLVKKLEDLVQVGNLVLEVDCNFTAWAHDKLGNSSDAYLLKCFNTYSDSMFSDDKFKMNNPVFGYKSDPTIKDLKFKNLNFTIPHELNMYLLTPTLQRVQRLQYDLVLRISALCSAPLLNLIDNIYFLDESRIYLHVLYNTDDYLIGPKGPLSRSCRSLPLTFKKAIFVETFYNIVIKYSIKVMDGDSDLCESIIFDSLAIWDSILDFFDLSVNPQIIEENCVVLLANALDTIKFTPQVDINELESFKNKFRLEVFNLPNMAESMLSLYTYTCLCSTSPKDFKFYSGRFGNQFPGVNTNTYTKNNNLIYNYNNSSNYRKQNNHNGNSNSFGSILDNNLDMYVVWLDGVRKKRMIIFGNMILFFRDNSLLQPVGFISFDSIYSVLAPHTLSQVHPNVQILENNSENDSFSCGTSRSSYSNEADNLKDTIRDTDMEFNRNDMYSPNYGKQDYNTVGYLKNGLLYNNNSNDNDNNGNCGSNLTGLKMVNNPNMWGTPNKSFNSKTPDKELKFECSRKDSSEAITLMRSYLDSKDFCAYLPKRGNNSTKTRYSTKSSRRSSLLDNLLVWGWQIRLELFDSCILDDFNYFDLVVDMEFTSPEHRRFWEQHIRDNPHSKPQIISWPYHSFFFDSI